MFKKIIISLNRLSKIENLKNLIVVLTFFGLWLSTQLSPMIQDYTAYILILTFGVLHGANDITLISSFSTKKDSTKPLLLAYLGAVAMVSVLFLVSKGAALVFFIAISAYHFGEQHLGKQVGESNVLIKALFFTYGLVILFMIFVLQLDKVEKIIFDVSGWVVGKGYFMYTLIIASCTLVAISITLYVKGQLIMNPVKELFSFFVLGLVFANSSLIWGFAIYFVFWHSMPSLKDQLDYLYGNASSATFKKYLKTSSIYWLISIGGLFLLYWLLKDKIDFFITAVLYVLAAITFPHVLVMSKVEAIKK